MKEILFRVYSSRRLSAFLKIISHASALVALIAYGFLLYLNFKESYLQVFSFILKSAIPFFVVSGIRRLINAPRPYELYDFYEKNPHRGNGSSFPSRHVFSIFLIATLAIDAYIFVALILFVFGILLALARVLLGVHFIRDVIAGALVGLVSGVLGLLVF